MLSRKSRPSRNESSKNVSTARDHEEKRAEIVSQSDIYCVAFLVDERYFLSGGGEGKIRRWRAEDCKEVGTPMDTGDRGGINGIAVSRDGKWVVSGTQNGLVTVWDAKNSRKATEFKPYDKWVQAVDVSPDGTRIATGAHDSTACVWSLSTGECLLGPLKHDDWVVGIRFSPDGRFIATGAWNDGSIRVYDGRDGRLLVDVPFMVNSLHNQSFVWTGDSKNIFALSSSGNISCLDASTGATLLKWRIHGNSGPRCIALAQNGTFIVASDDTSVSFWDTTTSKQIGSVVKHTAIIGSLGISADHNIVMGGVKRITLQNIYDVLPPLYVDDIFLKQENRRMRAERDDLKETITSLRAREDGSSAFIDIQACVSLISTSLDSKIAHLEETIQRLRNKLSDSQRAVDQDKDSLNEVIKSLRAQGDSSVSEITHLNETILHLRNELSDSRGAANKERDSSNETIKLLRAQEMNSNAEIACLKETVEQLHTQYADLLRALEQKHQCEVLFAEGRTIDSAVSLFEIVDTVSEEVRRNKFMNDWLAKFTNQCISALETTADEALNAEKHEEALAAYSTAISLSISTPNDLLCKWASTALMGNSAIEVLSGAVKFKLPRFYIYRAICDVLEGGDRAEEAVQCFQQMQSELGEHTSIHDEREQWGLGFRQRCTERLEMLGDTAMSSGCFKEAAEHFSIMLSLNLVDRMDILIKRTKARVSMNSWEDALSDADEVIKFSPTSHQGYELRHAALHGAGRHTEAVEAFHMMLSKLDMAPDESIRELRHRYVDAASAIRHIVAQTIRHMPRVLIDTTTGRLYDKRQQAEAFESLPVYSELVSSMTTELDHAHIWREVKKFYRYVMLSHRWQPSEPTFQLVENSSIYGLPASSANSKMQSFCELVRSFGFQWAWSDTCCVNQLDKGVQQESLVAMFRWYRGSSLTVVHLLGVLSGSQKFGCLWKSIWNTRGWTYQEYVASEVVQFYTEDWKPYLGLDAFNHKESSTILSEMERAMNFATQELATLRPGLDRVREKLYLASMRQTTREEDIAYSLFGIFNIAIPVIYGEGNQAVGRFLEHVLTGSGDVTILAWTGIPGSYNSCLPADLTVYNQIVPPHVPQPIKTTRMDNIVTGLPSSLPDLALAVRLYHHLQGLHVPSVAASRLRLPGIVFRLTEIALTSSPDPVTNLYVHHMRTPTFGDIEIKTADSLSGVKELCLVHPWIHPLLDQEFLSGAASLDETTQALRFIARLRQPFGALLFEPVSRLEYRRVAVDSLIMVQIHEEVPLTTLIDNIRTIVVQ